MGAAAGQENSAYRCVCLSMSMLTHVWGSTGDQRYWIFLDLELQFLGTELSSSARDKFFDREDSAQGLDGGDIMNNAQWRY